MLLVGCSPSVPWEGEPAVVILVMDGVRPEESLGEGPSSATGDHPRDLMPETWKSLVPSGARALLGLNPGITITAPAHCELLTGRRLALANYPSTSGEDLYRPELPALTDSFRAQHNLPGEQVVVTGNTGFISPFNTSLWPGLSDNDAPQFLLTGKAFAPNIPVDRDAPVLASVESLLREQHPRLLVANLHGVDRASHDGDDDDYIDTLDDLDRELAAFWETFQELPGYSETGYLVLVADHGRHQVSDDTPVWRHHGDDCLGCRRVPILILGPGVRRGHTIDTPALLSDVTATVAALLDTDMPGATGQPLHALFDAPLSAATPTGALEVSAAGGSLAETQLHNDPWQRSAVLVDGVQLSSDDALLAEAPVMAASESEQWVCFRELHLDLSATHAPWLPRCFARPSDLSEDWSELPPLADMVGPVWRPSLHPTSTGQLAVTWIHNPHGHGALTGTSGDVALVQSTLKDSTWSHTTLMTGVTFPDHPTALPDGPAAVAAALNTQDRRHHRQIFDSIGNIRALGPTLGGESWRLERPALVRDGDGLPWLSMLAHSPSGTDVVIAPAEGRWSPTVVSSPHDVMPNVSPHWATTDGEPVILFGALDAGQPQLCAARTDAAARCTDLGGVMLNDLSVDGDTAWLTVRDAEARWALQEVHWPELL
ncbi:MAG: hypothetical protein ACI8S6_002481 [Myxococcota bacterium]|jgi:hypothetical protein